MIATGSQILAGAALAWVAFSLTWACGWMSGRRHTARHPGRPHLRLVDPDVPSAYDWAADANLILGCHICRRSAACPCAVTPTLQARIRGPQR